MIEKIKKYILIILSGIFFSVPFFIPQLNLLSWFTAVPFFCIIAKDLPAAGLKTLIRCFSLFGMSFYLPVYIWFFWMYPLDFTGLTKPQAMLVVTAAWLGFPVLQTIPLLIIPFVLRFLRKMTCSIYPLVFAALWVIVEWVQSWFLTGLTWASLAVSQYRDLFAIQSISIFGSYIIGFLIIFTNTAIAVFVLRHEIKPLIMAVSLFFSNQYFGMLHTVIYDKGGNEFSITAVQGNISSYEKWDSGGIEKSLQVYCHLTLDAKEKTGSKIFLWTESALPVTIHENDSLYDYVQSFAVENDITIFTGAFTAHENGEYNSVLTFSSGEMNNNEYNKRHLVPFGEYLPLRNIITELFPFVENIGMLSDDLEWGKGANIIDTGDMNAGLLICFDSIFAPLAGESANAGANIILVVTNDSWYKDSPGIYQHNAQSVLRAVETGRYVVRAANTGISSIITPTGEISKQTNVYERTYITGTVALINGKTVYTVTGDLFVWLCIGMVIIIYMSGKIKKRPCNLYAVSV